MQDASVVVCTEGSLHLATPSATSGTPPPRPFTPAAHIGFMPFQGTAHPSAYSAHRRYMSMKSTRDMEGRPSSSSVLQPVRPTSASELKAFLTEDDMELFLRMQTPTEIPDIPQSPYILRPYHNPLPDIGRQRLLEEDENGLGEANVDSPPPPTYEETIQPIVEENEPDGEEDAFSRPTSFRVDRPQSGKSMKMSNQVNDGNSTNKEQEPKKIIDYNAIVALMNSDSPDIRLEATKEARTQLSTQNSPNIQSFLDAGILVPATESLQHENSVLQYEALWIITNIASGTSEDTCAVVESGAVKLLIDLLSSQDQKVQEQSLWAIGNIAGDSPEQRDFVVNAGLLEPLFNLLKEEIPESLSRNYAWVLSNLTRHKPLNYDPEDLELLLKAIKILIAIPDEDVRADCLWTLSYITDGPSHGIQMVVDEGMVPQLVEFMGNGSKKVRMPALRVCGNIATGSDEQTECVLQAGALQAIKIKFEEETTGLQKEMAWFVSNVTAGTKEQAQSVVDAGLLPMLIKAAKEAVYIVRKEATWAISNLTLLCDDGLVGALISAGGVQALLSVLNLIAEGQIVQISLEGLNNILKTKKESGKGLEEANNIIRENGGVDILETFLGSDNFDVHRLANEILTNYFPDSESIGEKEILESEESEKEEDSQSEAEEEMAVPNQAYKYMPRLAKEKEGRSKDVKIDKEDKDVKKDKEAKEDKEVNEDKEVKAEKEIILDNEENTQTEDQEVINHDVEGDYDEIKEEVNSDDNKNL